MEIIGRRNIKIEWGLIKEFLRCQWQLLAVIATALLGWSVIIKGTLTKLMYRQRGRFSQGFVNASLAGMVLLVLTFSGKLEEIISKSQSGNENQGGNYYLLATEGGMDVGTLVSNSQKGEVTEYRVEAGDTVSSIAQKFSVSIDTILWENNLKSADSIKEKQILRILPVTGLRYKVARGETIYSVAKKLQVDAQNIIDYPFNSFSNDETFALLAGQELIVPDGIKQKEIVVDTNRYLARTVAPIPGVVGEGNFMWPTSGRISQKYYWYHPAVDIANASGPDIVAAQGGTVVTAGWNAGGYGNYVIIDHGNGFKTLYGHMVTGSLLVSAGQKVNQGQKIGRMGSTGRSTGTHLHFEVIGLKGKVDPLGVLK
ncbi:MAG: M23 family metallopeptidase [Candidatus Shapirobacteria bacterium]|jgi:murein DD-endopeptidase MepM/ murein hydrolase activator NlpD